VKWRPILVAVLICAALAVVALWVIHSRQVGHWLQLHTGTINEPGPYYGFWSGFGSDLEEFGILGGIGAALYQLIKKYNCHEPAAGESGNIPRPAASSCSATAIIPTTRAQSQPMS
jgi:hypothetical protein